MALNGSLQQAKAAAEAANRELEAFSYSVAHDLRAPLRGIDGFSQALLEDYNDKLDDDGRTYLRFVRESAQHMAELIDDLLNLSRVARSELRQMGFGFFENELMGGAGQGAGCRPGGLPQ